MYIGAHITRVPNIFDMTTDPTDTTSTTTANASSDDTPALTDYTVIVPSLTGIVKWFNNKYIL